MLTEEQIKKFDDLLDKIHKIQEKDKISDKDYDLYLKYTKEISPLMDKADGELQEQFLWNNEAFYSKAKKSI